MLGVETLKLIRYDPGLQAGCSLVEEADGRICTFIIDVYKQGEASTLHRSFEIFIIIFLSQAAGCQMAGAGHSWKSYLCHVGADYICRVSHCTSRPVALISNLGAGCGHVNQYPGDEREFSLERSFSLSLVQSKFP